MGFIISVAALCSVIYGFVQGRKDLIVNQVELKLNELPENFKDFKIMQISDLHLGGFFKSHAIMKKVLKKTPSINPDLILFTGDLVNNFSNETDDWLNTFRELTNQTHCYSILGNHDYGNYTHWKNESEKLDNFNKIVNSHKMFGFNILNNENIFLKRDNDTIYIIGVENWGHPPFPQYANLEKAMKEVPVKAFKILMTHDPAHWDEIVKQRGDINLTLSGHTHGLQWGIVKAGITFSLAYFVRKQWGGLYNFENSYLYVNAGLGTVGFPWRINMPAEITVFTLKGIEID